MPFQWYFENTYPSEGFLEMAIWKRKSHLKQIVSLLCRQANMSVKDCIWNRIRKGIWLAYTNDVYYSI